PTRGLRLPDFLGIGSQKSGTTWLHARLQEHPDVFLPEEKEQHYFDWNYHQSLSSYAKVFEGAGDRICGEITPGYAILSPDRIRYLASIMPKVRVLFLMRDPVERAWSQVVMNAVELDGRDPEGIQDAEWIEWLEEPRVRERGDYLSVLGRWGERIPEDRLFVAFFEEIRENPGDLLQRVCRFLEVDPTPSDQGTWEQVVRPGRQVNMPDAVRDHLVAMLRPELRQLADRFGSPCTKWCERWLG
ncbi:MAG: sulfotransferase, partial [Phycisphaerales bacterium]|nr:sulfotransferase [Phycisphaerales bacterium]